MSSIYLAGTAKNIHPNHDFIGVAPELVRALSSLNHSFEPLQQSSIFISLNHSRSKYQSTCKGSSIKKRILIRIEPDSVHPIQFNEKIVTAYDLVITPGGVADIQSSSTFYSTPYRPSANQLYPRQSDLDLKEFVRRQIESQSLDIEHWKNRSKEIAFIASNKVSPSAKNNYRIRQDLVRSNSCHSLDVYGEGWDRNLIAKFANSLRLFRFSLKSGVFPNLQSIFSGMLWNYPKTFGFISDKHQVLADYKFNLIIENSNNFFTEKLLDALVNGCVPIYYGPRLEAFGIPDDVYIRFDGTLIDAQKALASLDEKNLLKIKKAGKEFITNQEFVDCFAADRIYSRMAQEIDRFLVGAT